MISSLSTTFRASVRKLGLNPISMSAPSNLAGKLTVAVLLRTSPPSAFTSYVSVAVFTKGEVPAWDMVSVYVHDTVPPAGTVVPIRA